MGKIRRPKRRISKYALTPENMARLTALWSKGAAVMAERRAERNRKIRRHWQARLTKLHARKLKRRMVEARAAPRPDADWQVGQAGKRRNVELGWRLVLSRLEFGRWYGMGELNALGKADGYARGSVQWWLAQRWRPEGFVERAPNADFDGSKADRQQLEPRWLYRVTQKGLNLRLGREEAGEG